MIKSIKIEELNVTTKKVGPDTFLFNCAGMVEGTLHITPYGSCQIELQGGYKFPENHCPACAMMTIAELYSMVEHANKCAGLSYATYRKVFKDGVNSILRH